MKFLLIHWTLRQKLPESLFVDVFRNEYGYLFDYVDGYMMDWSVRPNMIFTVAFDYSPLDRAQKKAGTRYCDEKNC